MEINGRKAPKRAKAKQAKGDINISINIMDSKIEGNFFHNQSTLLSKQNVSMYSHKDSRRGRTNFQHSKTVSNNMKEFRNFDKFQIKASGEQETLEQPGALNRSSMSGKWS